MSLLGTECSVLLFVLISSLSLFIDVFSEDEGQSFEKNMFASVCLRHFPTVSQIKCTVII